MANIECVNFTLKTSDINLSNTYANYDNTIVQTSTGIIKNNRTDYTWYNVNIRNIIGNTLYNKYDKFNICLNSYAMSQRGGTLDTEDNNTFYVKMSGLSWCSSYDQATKNNNYFQTIKMIKVLNTASSSDSQQFYDKSYFTFNKNAESCDINIKLLLISNDSIPTYNSNLKFLGHMSFNFSIYPIIDK